MKKLLFETLLVASAGIILALAANQVSPRGLKLTRNYFPATFPLPSNPTNLLSAAHTTAARLQSKGLMLADSNQVVQWFNDLRYREERILFIDARDDEHYQGGHIPGAYQLNYYRPEQHLPVVLQAGQSAEILVIYCNGGDCEDSELTAELLAGAFPREKIHVYPGGMAEWATNSLPIETGARNSGSLRTVQPIR